MTFINWLYEWLNVYKKPNVKKTTYLGIESTIRLHIPKELAEKPLEQVKVFDIDKALSILPNTRVKKLLYDSLVSALFKAYCLEFIPKDISKLIERVKFTSRQGQALSVDELNAFFVAIRGHKLERLFHFYVLTGVRRAEALTIRWCDIDFMRKTVLIRGTKTRASMRVLPLTDDIENILPKPKKVDGNARVFPFNCDYVTKTFKKYCKNHRLHDLRHTFATICAENNVHPTATQRLLGHSKIDTTMRIYTHVSSAFVAKEFKKVNFNNKK